MNRGTVEMEHKILSNRLRTITSNIRIASNETWVDEGVKFDWIFTQYEKHDKVMEELLHVRARFAHCVRRP